MEFLVTKMLGIELEYFLLDNEGRISNKADKIISSLKGLDESNLKQECGRSMIELVSFPHISSREAFGNFFDDFETFLYEISKNDLEVFPYATYPGKNGNIMRDDKRYAAKQEILGKKNFENAGHCTGFHFHYSLPSNSFNPNILFFYPDIRERQKQKVLNLFNAYIAFDPAITALMQSSPFLEGRQVGKDSRLIAYRGEPDFHNPEALYANYPEFGTLNKYAPDFNHMLSTIRERSSDWKKMLEKKGYSFSDFAKKEVSVLDSSWKPVKISPHGTIESRGCDINKLSKVVGMSTMLFSLSRQIQDNFSIVPSEIGDEEPFKIEENEIHVPTYQKLLELQRESAISGFQSDEVYKYSKAFIDMARSFLKQENLPPIRPFMDSIEDRQTTSDYIISEVKKIQGSTRKITDETAEEFALKEAEKIYRDFVITKKMCEHNLVF